MPALELCVPCIDRHAKLTNSDDAIQLFMFTIEFHKASRSLGLTVL